MWRLWPSPHLLPHTPASGRSRRGWRLLCAMAALLLSPLTGSYDLVLVLPAYLFAYVNAAWIVQNTEQTASPALLVGVILIVAAGLHDFTGMPGIHPRVVALVLQYLGAALILKARTDTSACAS